jgi:hypothetical protein
MAQNVVQNKDDLYLEDVIVYIADYSTAMVNDSITSFTGASWTNIGSVGEFSRETAAETVTPDSFNVEHDQVITKEAENLTLNVQEIEFDIINKLKGLTGQQVTVSATATSTDFVIVASQLSLYESVKFPQQDFSGSATVPQAISSTDVTIYVDGSTGVALTSTSYSIVEMNDGQGNYGLVPISTGWDVTLASSVTYNVTPKAQSITYNGGADEITPFMMWIDANMSDGRNIKSYYPEVYYVSGGAVADSAQGTGQYKNVPFSLQGREHKTYTYNSRRQYKVEIKST